MDEVIQRIQQEIKEWPTQPGVYVMRDPAKRILYVGKAKNLRSRIKSYFLRPEDLAGKTRVLVRKVAEIEFTVTGTELEALLLECNLIKKHRPRYNIRLKDDKSYPYAVLDFSHPFPQLRITRKVIPDPKLKYFGPFSAGVIEIGRFLLKTFQIRDCSDEMFKSRERPCLNYEIGTCTAPCVGYVTQEAYGKQIQDSILFLKGKKQELIRSLKAEMEDASEKLQYERAKTIRDKIAAVEKLTEKQGAVLTEKQRDVDILGCYPSGNDVQWVILFIRAGFMSGRRAIKITVPMDTVEESTRSFLEQFYATNLVPDEIWLMSDFPEREDLARLLTEKAQKPVKVAAKRGEQAIRLLNMAHENAKLIYQDSQKRQGASSAAELQRVLSLAEPPHTIEGIDVSNFQGQQPAVALVHFADERPLKSQYRTYHPRTVEGQDDFAMIYETVHRRYSNPENALPDLLLIDGGKGQLASAVKALKELNLELPVCSLAKARTESNFTRKEVDRSEERIFIPNQKNPIVLREGHPALRLLQQVRDEAHRFSVKMHRARRKKFTLVESPLTDIRGIGPKTKAMLLQIFATLEAIRAASVEDLVTAGIPKSRAEKVYRALHAETPSTEE
jgi:excinuclease ABC subunit C